MVHSHNHKMMSTPPERIRKRRCLPFTILSVDHDGSNLGRVKSKTIKMVDDASPLSTHQ
jgi:hypothetical protein